MPILLGVDVGSSGCKVTAVTEGGQIVAVGRETYPTAYPRPGWAEQDPEAWYRAACSAIRLCLSAGAFDVGDVAALAIVGPAHNVALMDAGGAVIHPTIHWSDLRSLPQAERLEAEHGGRIFDISYQRVNPSWTLSQLLWLKENEPDLWRRLKRVLVTKDYVRYRLTGHYQTDFFDAIGLQLFDVAGNVWSEELCDLIEFPTGNLPPPCPPHETAGALLPEAARATGLPAGIPVAVSSSDVTLEAAGVGALHPGQGIVKLGTAACVNLVTDQLRPSPKTLTYPHVVPGRGFTITATNAGTASVRWFSEAFGPLPAADPALGPYERLTALAAEAPPGCEGLLFHPYLMGERSPYWDPRLRADFVGIGSHHGLRHFARAVLEGVAFSLRDCSEAVIELGEPIHDFRLLGGGAQSALWPQIICDVLGRPLLLPAVKDAAFGAALLAGVAVGLYSGWESAVDQCVPEPGTILPDPARHALYSDYFAVYQDVTRDLARHSHRLAILAEKQIE
jgi:xylulokinase